MAVLSGVPSHTGTTCVALSPASTTTPCVAPVEKSASTAWLCVSSAGTLKPSKSSCASRSLWNFGDRCGSHTSTGCSLGCTPSCPKRWLHTRSTSSHELATLDE